jgi:hypothetical protein
MEKLLEALSIKMFKAARNYNLVNVNQLKVNFPAFDLLDRRRLVTIQVTSNASSQKVKRTIKEYEKCGFDSKYKKLIIFGFCKAGKVKVDSAKYEVMGVSKIIAELLNAREEKQIQEVIDAVRMHADYARIHPYDDLNCLSILLETIDRNAIKHGMSCEGDYSHMVSGLNEVTELISKGTINGKEKGKAIDGFRDSNMVHFMEDIRDSISRILATINQSKNARRSNSVCLHIEEMERIDAIKQDIVEKANAIAEEYSIPYRIEMHR